MLWAASAERAGSRVMSDEEVEEAELMSGDSFPVFGLPGSGLGSALGSTLGSGASYSAATLAWTMECSTSRSAELMPDGPSGPPCLDQKCCKHSSMDCIAGATPAQKGSHALGFQESRC